MQKLIEYINFTEDKQVGLLYHYTDSLENMISIFDTGLKGNFKIASRTPGYENKKSYSYSFSRDKFVLGFGRFRFTLDGSKMSNKYKISPITEPQWNRSNQMSESEERIITSEPILDIKPYLIEMSIIVYNDNEPENMEAKELHNRYLTNTLSKYEKMIFRKHPIKFVVKN